LGKAAGADLLGGKVTLPLIYLMTAEPSTCTMVQRVLLDGTYETVRQEDLREAMARTGVLEKARALADEYAENARAALDDLPDSEYCDSLRALPTYVLKRDR
jgi:geranylgeranyl pyrophosphate synthase